MKELHSPIPLLAEHALQNKPGPHYLSGEILVDADKRGLNAIAIFPSSDRTIGDRGHVNVAHYLFGLWNAAHILGELNGFENTLSTGGVWKAHRVARPDTAMNLRVAIVDADIRNRVARGLIEAVYSIDGSSFGEFTSDFFARRRV